MTATDKVPDACLVFRFSARSSAAAIIALPASLRCLNGWIRQTARRASERASEVDALAGVTSDLSAVLHSGEDDFWS